MSGYTVRVGSGCFGIFRVLQGDRLADDAVRAAPMRSFVLLRYLEIHIDKLHLHYQAYQQEDPERYEQTRILAGEGH